MLAKISQFLKKLFPSRQKIILDTNVFVSAFWNRRSASRTILKAIQNGSFILLYSRNIKQEVLFILRKMPRSQEYIDFVKKLFQLSFFVDNPPKISYIKDDPSDNTYLACAKKGKADFIISSDVHLLRVGRYGKTKIVSPTNFIKYMANKGITKRFPPLKLHKKETFKRYTKSTPLPRTAGRKEKGISRRGKH